MKKRRSGKKNFWKENYTESWKYIVESRKFIYAILLIFFGFVILGAFLPVPDAIAEQIFEIIEELLLRTEGMSFLELMGFIFFNNLQTSFLGMIFGVVFGIYSVIITLVNGYLLGFISARAVSMDGLFILWRLFPHGIFELPAVFISMGLGLKLGTFIFQKKRFESLKEYLKNSLRAFIFIILPFLFVASIIESALIIFGR
jgi:stage II sporulation protein M